MFWLHSPTHNRWMLRSFDVRTSSNLELCIWMRLPSQSYLCYWFMIYVLVKTRKTTFLVYMSLAVSFFRTCHNKSKHNKTKERQPHKNSSNDDNNNNNNKDNRKHNQHNNNRNDCKVDFVEGLSLEHHQHFDKKELARTRTQTREHTARAHACGARHLQSAHTRALTQHVNTPAFSRCFKAAAGRRVESSQQHPQHHQHDPHHRGKPASPRLQTQNQTKKQAQKRTRKQMNVIFLFTALPGWPQEPCSKGPGEGLTQPFGQLAG